MRTKITVIIYTVLMFVLGVTAGLTYEHYKRTSELLPLEWFGMESDKENLKKQYQENDEKIERQAQQIEQP